MANVWFVQRVGGVWKRTSAEPAFQRPLRDLVFKLDLGAQRRLASDAFPDPADGGAAAGRARPTKVFVEVIDSDLSDSYFGGYFSGWYDSPFSPAEANRRLKS